MSWASHFFHGTAVLLERTDEQMMLIQSLGIFLEMNKVNLSLKRNNWQYLSLMVRFRLSSENEKLGKLESATVGLPVDQYLKDISEETSGEISWYCRIKHKSTFGIVGLHSKSIFSKWLMNNVRKSYMDKSSIQSTRQINGL